MLQPKKHQRSYHQGAQLNLEPHQGAHFNLESNDNEEGPVGHSHLMSMTVGKVLWDTLTPCQSISEIPLTKQGSQLSHDAINGQDTIGYTR